MIVGDPLVISVNKEIWPFVKKNKGSEPDITGHKNQVPWASETVKTRQESSDRLGRSKRRGSENSEYATSRGEGKTLKENLFPFLNREVS